MSQQPVGCRDGRDAPPTRLPLRQAGGGRSSLHDARRRRRLRRCPPPYPDALWQRIRDLGLRCPGNPALDLGAGNGQTTDPLLAAQLDVTAVEPGPRLVAEPCATRTGARVLITAAGGLDAAGLQTSSFEVLMAATSIHWMGLDVVLPAVARLLAAEGCFPV